ncbi:MAG: 5-formaminoimidazole-4-carboxamide-1-(beta)-D-ribofuranosyl 5'-monophosphate synthetase [Thermoplasmata archaeon]|nr:MAG: 5-formaminoimidazole-4-carboxamide-1-(beta)-D-ribofuranosyl 5'-monophosphate synthetase [Thermoplasmata archaeon]
MIEREKIWEIVDSYDDVKIGVIGSHSALDVCDGAVEEGFKTLVVCQRGREKTYCHYFRAKRVGGAVERGVVDECMVLDKFSDIISSEKQEKLRREGVVFIPNRSFTSYVSIDKIEDEFYVPMFGSRNMLRIEEREEKHNYYWLLERAGLPYPRKIEDPKDIDGLVIVKLHHAVKKLERGFFTAASYKEYEEKANKLLRQGVITKEDLQNARIEEYVIGPVFNLDFFYSPLERDMSGIELLGIDWRFETSLDGHVRLPAGQQLTLPEKQAIPEYTVCGHNSATLRESLLEKAFILAEKFVKASQEYYPPGIIGPFCLQTCVDKDLNFYIYDVAPRIGGGTNIHMALGHPYGNTLWRKNTSTGRRMAMEIRRAVEEGRLKEIVT